MSDIWIQIKDDDTESLLNLNKVESIQKKDIVFSDKSIHYLQFTTMKSMYSTVQYGDKKQRDDVFNKLSKYLTNSIINLGA